jgi:hypothetical protein
LTDEKEITIATDDETKMSLERMQIFDIQTLPREKELGEKFNFKDALQPAERLVSLYKRLSISALDDLPTNLLTQIRNKANEDFNRFKEVLEFNPEQPSAPQTRVQIINNLSTAYD